MNVLNEKNMLILSLGGNYPNTLEKFNEAKKSISLEIGNIIKESPVYVTEPWGFKETVLHFYNQVISIETKHTPLEILDILKKIETALGREKKKKKSYESRPIDLDILLYNQSIIKNKKIELPHPRLHERKFILIPVCDIYPQFIHPVFNKTIKELLLQSNDTTHVTLLT